MKPASLAIIKKELKTLSNDDLMATCLRLAKSKKETKELLNYLLFEANSEDDYINTVKEDVVEGFKTINASSFYFAKKTIRKVLRITNKHIKFSDEKKTEIELLIFFCQTFNQQNLNFSESKVMINLYANIIKKIDKGLASLHEDLQFDYNDEVQNLKEQKHYENDK